MSKFGNLAGMSIDELEAHCQALRGKKEKLQDELREAIRILDGKRATDSALAKVAAMSSAERAALAQVIQTEGVPSNESVSEV